ncbi:hypothetical protein GCM10008916_16870 [Clostridium nitritogenes]|uniref:DNA 3'-5' helicase n=1 Tax=Clostridium nitritogenes TaxID=83340 RepID=A0ABP3X3K4_9CLOT
MNLNVEQKRIIEAEPNGHMIIKGVAGSGKTTVAVNRLPILIDRYAFQKDDRILMITYNKALTKYVKYIFEDIQKNNNEIQDTLIFDKPSDDILDISTIDSIIYKYFMSYCKKNKLSLKVATQLQAKNALLESILEVSKKYPEVKFVKSQNLSFFKDEITWIKACGYTELVEYQNADRIGRMAKNSGEGPQRLIKNSNARQAIYEVLVRYNERLQLDGLVDFQDLGEYALKYIRENNAQKYTHILIDESQDLSKIQLDFIKELYNEKEYSSITFILDVAQSIYAHSWLVKGRSFTSLGFDMTGKSRILSKNYRTTTQIAQAAYSLIENDKNLMEDDNFVKPSLIDRQGDYPIYKCFKTKDDEKIYIKNILDDLKEDYQLKDIAIVARTKNQLKEMDEYLKENDIPCKVLEANNKDFKFEEESVKLITMHSIKGLEFKVVIIVGLNDKIMPLKSSNEIEDEEVIDTLNRKLLYVAMTRSTELLFMTSDGKPSKYVKEINCKYLKLKKASKIKMFHRINMDKYIFKEKLQDQYGNEEVIRQWFLNEMKSSYGYPEELLDVEVKTNIGSNVGLVDVVISIYKNKTKVPYIYGEIKSWGLGIEDGLRQIKSYMSGNSDVQYGVVTDGNDIEIINKEFEKVKDIPAFSSSMLPEEIESVTYIDKKHNRTYEIVRDSIDRKEIILYEGNEELKFDSNDLIKIPIYNEIAAGVPITMNSQIEEDCYMPRSIVSDNSFILKVRGDSMIDANINDGDYVVIKSQNTATQGEIVAAGLDGEATLKKYMRMGSSILLVAENSAYEPIMVEEGNVNIMGVLVGIMKK